MKHDPPCGEPAALASLYERWRKPLLRLFQSRSGNQHEAEDATQDVFVRLAVARKTLAPEEEKPYLSTTARSVSTDRWRRNGGGAGPDLVSMESAVEEIEAQQAQHPHSPLEAAAYRQRIERLNDAVSELPERQRQAFLLNRIDGLTQDEVAAAMGISERMVAKHLSRAMAYCQLRVKYANAAQMQRLLDHNDAAQREDSP